ncbi:MAG: alanine dehydrogenase [Proteobacteria bacterium]|nr:alanine dehydrogenase [Pseudomonadota bacterium]
MIIAVPRERKEAERRVAITPHGAAMLTSKGHRILVEKNAGLLSGFSNEEYKHSKCEIIPTLEELWSKAELLLKVKEPSPEELQYFREDLAVFSFLHPAAAPDMTKALVEKKVLGIDYDLVMTDDGRMPILEPMSAIAGKLSVQIGANLLQANKNGKGVLLGGVAGVKPAKVLVLGAGVAGVNAAKIALGMGAEVVVCDINTQRLEQFTSGFLKAKTIYSTPKNIKSEVIDTDLIIGSVLIPGALSPILITKEMLKLMRPGSVIVDISIDQGGIAETSRPTKITEPTYIEEDIIHYCVPNMPALVPQTSTMALTNATLYWLDKIATLGLDKFYEIKELKKSIVSYRGNITNKRIAEALKMSYKEFSK